MERRSNKHGPPRLDHQLKHETQNLERGAPQRPHIEEWRDIAPPADIPTGRQPATAGAEEIAARTVNKERARSGEAKTASRTSKQDMSSSRRGGLRSHSGSGGPTYEQLYSEARRRNIKGRSSMNKAQLERALGR